MQTIEQQSNNEKLTQIEQATSNIWEEEKELMKNTFRWKFLNFFFMNHHHKCNNHRDLLGKF